MKRETNTVTQYNDDKIYKTAVVQRPPWLWRRRELLDQGNERAKNQSIQLIQKYCCFIHWQKQHHLVAWRTQEHCFQSDSFAVFSCCCCFFPSCTSWSFYIWLKAMVLCPSSNKMTLLVSGDKAKVLLYWLNWLIFCPCWGNEMIKRRSMRLAW